ncbi:MAG TPA: hypothetical protein VGR88_00355 [Ktedonobacterales bacterium]|nr:hypothetical protein [Ktedonobacterales bacterium]
MRGFWTRRRLAVGLTLLTLAALIGAYAGIRSYMGENADAVSIVAKGTVVGFVTNSAGNLIPAGPPIKPVVRLHFSGSQARQIQRAVNTYSGPDGRGDMWCNPDTREIYDYVYTLTFTLNGVVIESASGESQNCYWRLSILGSPSIFTQFTDNDRVLPSELRDLTNNQLPEPFAPDYS